MANLKTSIRKADVRKADAYLNMEEQIHRLIATGTKCNRLECSVFVCFPNRSLENLHQSNPLELQHPW